MLCGCTSTTPLPTPHQRCACQYSGKYLASPKILLAHMHCQYSGKPFASPVSYGCISLRNLCTCAEWLHKSVHMHQGPFKRSLPIPRSLYHFLSPRQPPHEHLFSPPISKLPRGFAVQCGSFSLLLNYNNMQRPD